MAQIEITKNESRELLSLTIDPKDQDNPRLHFALQGGGELHLTVSWFVLYQIRDLLKDMKIDPMRR